MLPTTVLEYTQSKPGINYAGSRAPINTKAQHKSGQSFARSRCS
jgi:hypothetical protein